MLDRRMRTHTRSAGLTSCLSTVEFQFNLWLDWAGASVRRAGPPRPNASEQAKREMDWRDWRRREIFVLELPLTLLSDNGSSNN
jgi:hypothetical protein